MTAFLTSDDPLTVAALALWGYVDGGADSTEFATALADQSANLNFPIPGGWTHAAFVGASAPPDPSAGGSNPTALSAWVASI